jgi:hypothetical protein
MVLLSTFSPFAMAKEAPFFDVSFFGRQLGEWSCTVPPARVNQK